MKKYKLFFFAAVCLFFFNACNYSFIEEVELPPIDGGGNGNETVFFSTDIQPIFNANCVTCHTSRNPILTESEAYNSIANAKYVNVESPADSYLIQHVGPNSTSHTQRHFTAAQAQLIMTWMAEGAKNN